MAQKERKLNRGRKLPSVEEWLADCSTFLLPNEQFWHFYIIHFVIDGVSYVKVGGTHHDIVQMRNWKIKLHGTGELIPYRILCLQLSFGFVRRPLGLPHVLLYF